eukprot:3292837-Rhodomonas_salina.2
MRFLVFDFGVYALTGTYLHRVTGTRYVGHGVGLPSYYAVSGTEIGSGIVLHALSAVFGTDVAYAATRMLPHTAYGSRQRLGTNTLSSYAMSGTDIAPSATRRY